MTPATIANGDAPAVTGEPCMITCGCADMYAARRIFEAPYVKRLLCWIGAGVLMCTAFIKFLLCIRD